MTTTEAVERLRNMEQAKELQCVESAKVTNYVHAHEHAKDAEALRMAIAAMALTNKE